MEDVRVVFCNNLKILLERKPCRQKEFARCIDVPEQTVSQWVRGAFMPEWDRMALIANFFGVRISQLLDEHGFDLCEDISGEKSKEDINTKTELADPEIAEKWLERLRMSGVKSITLEFE